MNEGPSSNSGSCHFTETKAKACPRGGERQEGAEDLWVGTDVTLTPSVEVGQIAVTGGIFVGFWFSDTLTSSLLRLVKNEAWKDCTPKSYSSP